MVLEGSVGEYALGEFVYSVLGSSSAEIAPTFEMYLEGAWVDVTADVRRFGTPRVRRGFDGSQPTDRVAPTGTLSLTLDNSTNNSGGLLGYYSPDHANCRTDFGIGTRIRFSITDTLDVTWYKFHGKIVSIDPEMGSFAGRGLSIQAVDYMEYLATTNLQRLAVQTSKRVDEVITTVVNSLPTAPINTSYATGIETLAYALHVDQDERTSAMSAAQKALQSDLGYLFVRGNSTDGETLVYQNRYTRSGEATAATLNDTMTGLMLNRRVDSIYNDVRVPVYPVRIDAAATTVLATAQTEFSVAAGASLVMTMRYRDPSGASTRVSGTDMVTPADSTDYEFTATPGSGNNDLSGSVTVSASFGANTAQVTVTNNAAVTAYSGGAETFQLRGKGIYPYDPVESIYSDTASIVSYGTRSLTYDMPYQSNINTGQSFAAELLNRYKNPTTNTESVTFAANRSATFQNYAAQLDIGSKISLTETVTGISDYFYINSVEYELHTPNIIVTTWGLEPIQQSGNVGNWGTDANDSGVWGTDDTDSTDWVF